MKRGVVTFGGSSVFVRMAVTSVDQIQGLRGISHLEWNSGMLFVARSLRSWQMTMEGVLVPLRIFYLDDFHTVTNIDEAPVGWPGFKPRIAKYVLETSAEWRPAHVVVGARAGIWEQQ